MEPIEFAKVDAFVRNATWIIPLHIVFHVL